MNSLVSLVEKTKNLKIRLKNNPDLLIHEDLKELFTELEQLITPEELNIALNIFDDFSLLLEEKLIRIKEFIHRLLYKEQILNYLETNPADQDIITIFHNSFINPVFYDGISFTFLEESFKKLTKNKNRSKKSIVIPIDIPSISGKEINQVKISSNDFEMKMKLYYNKLIKKLPNSIKNLIDNYSTSEEYYMQFTLLLQLLQEGYLKFNQKSKTFEQGEKEFE